MINSAYIPDLLKLLVDEGTLETIDTDPLLSVTRYDMTEEGTLGYVKQLCIATNSKKLFTPEESHQLLAKGIVYLKEGVVHPDAVFKYTLVAFPYTKIYNSFETPAVNDALNISIRSDINPNPQIMRKLDGTLIARWVYEGKVFFSTRGRIITLEKNEFYSLVMKVISEKGYDILLDPEYATEATIIMELIGPSNIILEIHTEDDLVVTGVYSLHKNVYVDPTRTSVKDSGLNIVEVYDYSSPQEVLDSFRGIQEGVIVNWFKWDHTSEQEVVICRIKYKSEDYISLLKAKNKAGKESLMDMVIENDLSSWEDVENYLYGTLMENPYREEIVKIYKDEWEGTHSRLLEIYSVANSFVQTALVAASIGERKDRFFFVRDTVGSEYAGIIMGIIDGKRDTKDILRVLARSM